MIASDEITPPLLPKTFRYIPNHGNAGDAVIGLAMDEIVRKQCVTIVDSPNENVPYVVGGGGNLVPMYSYLAAQLTRLPPEAHVIMLPSSSFGRWEYLARFQKVRIYCRELETFALAELNGIPATLCHDLAFQIDYESLLMEDRPKPMGTISAFRSDGESAKRFAVAEDNRDLSLEWPQAAWLLGKSHDVAREFIDGINRYQRVRTDRLHVGIVATMLGKDVEFYPNSYFKNRAVFEYSLSRFSNCRWMG